MPDLQQLKGLASAIPGLNQKATEQAQAARQVQLQQQLGAAQGQPGPAQAQQLAAQNAQQQGQIAAQGQQQTQQMLGQVAQMGLQTQAANQQTQMAQAQMSQQAALAQQQQAQALELSRGEIESRKRVTSLDIKSSKRIQQAGFDLDSRLQVLSIKQRKDLAMVGRDIQAKLFDSRMTFNRDEMGRKFTNTRQLADYAKANAQTELQFNGRMQMMKQASQRKIQLMETVHATLVRELKQTARSQEAEKDFTHQKQMAKDIRDLEEKIRRAKADAANEASMWGEVGGLIGGTVGAIYGGPQGAMVGYQAGKGVGQMAYSATTDKVEIDE